MALLTPDMSSCSEKRRCLTGDNKFLAYDVNQPCPGNKVFDEVQCDCVDEYPCGTYYYQLRTFRQWDNLYQCNTSCTGLSLQLAAGTSDTLVSSDTINNCCGLRLRGAKTIIDTGACCYPNPPPSQFSLGIVERLSQQSPDWIYVSEGVGYQNACGCCVYRFGTALYFRYLKIWVDGQLWYDGLQDGPPPDEVIDGELQ